jgi:hypothetical protein
LKADAHKEKRSALAYIASGGLGLSVLDSKCEQRSVAMRSKRTHQLQSSVDGVVHALEEFVDGHDGEGVVA